MPTKLKISNAAADPAKWDSTFKAKVAEAGDGHFFTQQIFSKWWKKGLNTLFLPPNGADLELTIDGDAKKFSWTIKAKDAKAGAAFFAKHGDLKAVAAHHGIVSGAPEEESESEAEEPVAQKTPEPVKAEDPAKKLDADYRTLLGAVDKSMSAVDEPAKLILKAVEKKILEDKAKGVADLHPLTTLATQAIEKAKHDTEARKKNPAHGIVPPNADELAKAREAAEIKFRKDQREAQKAAGKRKEEEAAANPQPAAAEEAEDPNRWVPRANALPFYGRLSDAQKTYVQSKLDDFNSRGKGGNAHAGVGGVVTLDMTGPLWGTSGRGAWRLQIMTGSRSLNIVDHAGKTWNG